MSNLKPDQNNRQIGGGLVQGTSTVLPFRVNPSNNKLLIEIIPHSPQGTIISSRDIPIDENTRQAGAAVTDNVNETIIPITCTDIVNFPCVRVEDPALP